VTLAIEGPGFVELVAWLDSKGVTGTEICTVAALFAGAVLAGWLWTREKEPGS